MKNVYLFAILLFSVVACNKNKAADIDQDNISNLPQVTYDTTAIDSFGPGATSQGVMSKINAVAIKREKDSLAKIAKAEQEKAEAEKAKKEAESKKESKSSEVKTPATNTEESQPESHQ